MRFRAALIDLKKKIILASFPVIRASSWEEATRLAFERLKKRRIYRTDSDVREFVRIFEIKEDFSCAGFEFDVLPEALRRFSMDISILKQTEQPA
ncbi:MAG: hypothetical protein WAP23_02000 [Candidatus Spechtbacterales bacterium]